MKILFTIIMFSVFALPFSAQAATSITKKKEMIKSSIASYKGNCPCPYSIMKNGKSCGKTSAWSKPGGVSPLCYVTDIK